MSAARVFVGGVIVALMLVLAAVIWIDRAAPVSVVVNPLPAADIRVFINGEVATPGVVTVPDGARLTDVADAAGGFTDEADYSVLNLAARVGDGENIVIPSVSPDADPVFPPGVSLPPSGAPLNLNAATIPQLDELPGIGDVLAGRIVDYRDEHGPFESIDQLVDVDGISSRMVDELRPLVMVGDGG